MWLVSTAPHKVDYDSVIAIGTGTPSNDFKTEINRLGLAGCLSKTDTIDILVERNWVKPIRTSAVGSEDYKWTKDGIVGLQCIRKIHPMQQHGVTASSIRDKIHKLRVEHDNVIAVQFTGMAAKSAVGREREESITLAAYSTLRAGYEAAFKNLKSTHRLYKDKNPAPVQTPVNSFESLSDFLEFDGGVEETTLATTAASLQHLDPILCGFSSVIEGVAATSRTDDTMEGDRDHLERLIWHTAHAVGTSGKDQSYIMCVTITPTIPTTPTHSTVKYIQINNTAAEVEHDGQKVYLTLESAANIQRIKLKYKPAGGTETGANGQHSGTEGTVDMYSEIWGFTWAEASCTVKVAFGPVPEAARAGGWYYDNVYDSATGTDVLVDNMGYLFKSASNSRYCIVDPTKILDACSTKQTGPVKNHMFAWTQPGPWTKRMLDCVLYPASGHAFISEKGSMNVKALLTPEALVIKDTVPIGHDELTYTAYATPDTEIDYVDVWRNSSVPYDANLPIVGMMSMRKKRKRTSKGTSGPPTMTWSVGVRGSPFLTAMEVVLNMVHYGFALTDLRFGGFHYGVLCANTGLQETSTARVRFDGQSDALNKALEGCTRVTEATKGSPMYAPARVNVRGCDVYGMSTTCCIKDYYEKTPEYDAAELVLNTFLQKHTPPITSEGIKYMTSTPPLKNMGNTTWDTKMRAAHAYALGTDQATDRWHDEKVLSRLEYRLQSIVSAWFTGVQAFVIKWKPGVELVSTKPICI